MGMPLPTTSTCSAAAALCALIIPFVIGPSADAVSATGAFVPPPATKTSTKQTCAGARAGARHATSRCHRSIICSMNQDGNDGNGYSENSPTNERSSRQRYTQKRASPQAPRGGRGDGKDDGGPRRRRRVRPRQNRQNNFGGARADGRTSRSKRRNTSPWPRYKSEIDAALEIGADAGAFEASIDSFLEGEYSQPFAEEAPAPHPGLSPRETLDCALRSLRRMDEPYESHGAAVFMRFCVPLTNSERWGLSSDLDPWKTILRGALSPNMLARQLRASSSFASLLDWKRLDVSDGFAIPSERLELGVGTTLAFVNAAVYFQEGVEPAIIQFTLRKIGGAWMIDDAVVSKRDWFVSPEDDKDSDEDGIDRNDSGIGGGKGMP